MIRHTRGNRCCFVEVDVARALTEEHHADVRRPCVNGGIYDFGRRKAAYLDGDSGHGRGVDRPANICTTPMRTVKERSEEPTSELQSLMRIYYAVFCLKINNTNNHLHELYEKLLLN